MRKAKILIADYDRVFINILGVYGSKFKTAVDNYRDLYRNTEYVIGATQEFTHKGVGIAVQITVIASEAKQSLRRDCFGTSCLAMTV